MLAVTGTLNSTEEKFGLLQNEQIHIQSLFCSRMKDSELTPAQSLCIHISHASQQIASRSQVTSSLHDIQANCPDNEDELCAHADCVPGPGFSSMSPDWQSSRMAI